MYRIFFFFLTILTQGTCSCFFPYEYQGVYKTQKKPLEGNTPTYTDLTVVPDGIVEWGVCYWKYENMAILNEITSGESCMRCFHIHLRTANIMQIYTEKYQKCYHSVEEAIRSCITEKDMETKRSTEFTLYKNLNFNGITNKPMCPFVGQLDISYTHFEKEGKNNHCVHIKKNDSKCDDTHILKFNLTKCTVRPVAINWECLGNWRGSDKNNYLAVKDLRAEQTGGPTYRCGMYHVSKTGRVSLSLSQDSTCTGDLKSPWQGLETLMISEAKSPSLPSGVYENCKFPDWAQGKWQDIDISRGRITLRKDSSKTEFRSMCLRNFGATNDRFVLFTRDQCNNEHFTCIWIRKRSTNVLEYKLSPLKNRLRALSLCSDETFRKEQWHTMGKEETSVYSCPVSGEHLGVLPDDPSLCARLASDCTNPHKMVYQIFPCKNETVPYEERRYQCLGGWNEGGVSYTYTWREDVKRYECFAGVQASRDEVYIAEAGQSCTRGLQPLVMGMKMVKKGSCTTWEETLLEVGYNLIQYIPYRIRSSNKFPRMTQYENAALRSISPRMMHPTSSLVLFVTILIFYWL